MAMYKIQYRPKGSNTRGSTTVGVTANSVQEAKAKFNAPAKNVEILHCYPQK